MKNMINIRNSIIVILCMTIICMTIGFIIMAVKLKIKNDSVQEYKVIFSEIKKASSIKGTSQEPTSSAKILDNSSEISMNFTLNSIHDEIIYIATIKNEGTMPAEIVDIMESPNYNDEKYKQEIHPITISTTDIKGKIIPPGETLNIKIIAYYNPSNNKPKTSSIDYKIGLISRSR